jgi:hypothetical protein
MDDIPTKAKPFSRWVAERQQGLSSGLQDKAHCAFLGLRSLEQPAAAQSLLWVELAMSDYDEFCVAYEAEQMFAG